VRRSRLGRVQEDLRQSASGVVDVLASLTELGTLYRYAIAAMMGAHVMESQERAAPAGVGTVRGRALNTSTLDMGRLPRVAPPSRDRRPQPSPPQKNGSRGDEARRPDPQDGPSDRRGGSIRGSSLEAESQRTAWIVCYPDGEITEMGTLTIWVWYGWVPPILNQAPLATFAPRRRDRFIS
jgi:hypothetical protein